MKKTCWFFAALMTAATLIFLNACAPTESYISERRCDYFTAADEFFEITAVSGVRETPYETDGTVGALISYTLVTVSPVGVTFDANRLYEYEANVPVSDPTRTGKDVNKKFGGALVVHPFAASYSAEFEYETCGGFTVSVMYEENGEKVRRDYELKSLVTEDMMAYSSAVSAAKNEFDTSAQHEVRVRLIKSPVGEGLSWYVAFYFEDGKSCGVLLDPTTAKVLAKRTD